MKTTSAPSGSPQVVAFPPPSMGKGSRPKVRTLSVLLRRLAVAEFRGRKSSEDVAELLRLPARTITDAVDADQYAQLEDLRARVAALESALRNGVAA